MSTLSARRNAGNAGKLFAASIAALDLLLIVIPISLLTDLSGVGVAGHIGTGDTLAAENNCEQPAMLVHFRPRRHGAGRLYPEPSLGKLLIPLTSLLSGVRMPVLWSCAAL